MSGALRLPECCRELVSKRMLWTHAVRVPLDAPRRLFCSAQTPRTLQLPRFRVRGALLQTTWHFSSAGGDGREVHVLADRCSKADEWPAASFVPCRKMSLLAEELRARQYPLCARPAFT